MQGFHQGGDMMSAALVASKMLVETLKVEEYAPWVTPDVEDSASLPTTHLPENVVKHPFRLMLDVRTVKDQPRMGGYWVSLNWDGAMNPGNLTSEERQYIMGALEFALEHLKDSHATVLSDCLPSDGEDRQCKF